MNTPPYARSGIYIKPENRGKFTSYANRHGESVQEAAARILGNKEDYPPYLVKRANFARNAAGWQKGQNGMEVEPPPTNGLPSNIPSFDTLNPLKKISDVRWVPIEDPFLTQEMGLVEDKDMDNYMRSITKEKYIPYIDEKTHDYDKQKMGLNPYYEPIYDSDVPTFDAPQDLPTIEVTASNKPSNNEMFEETRQDVLDIYGSKGYLRKLLGEQRKSSKYGSMDDALVIRNERMNRAFNVPIEEMDKIEALKNVNGENGSLLGYMIPNEYLYRAPSDIPRDSSWSNPYIRFNQEFYGNAELYPTIFPKVSTIGVETIGTITEEIDHAAHVPIKNEFYNERAELINDPHYGYKYTNVSPYAQKVISENIKTSDTYMQSPTEVVGKKRAIETFLINMDKMKPGGHFGQEQYRWLEKNKDLAPLNAKQLMDATDKKGLFRIMNRIASNEQGGTMNYGRYGMQVSPYIQKGQNGMMAGYPPNDPIIQPYGYNPYSTAALFGTRPILSQGALEVSQQTLDNETPNRNYLSTTPLSNVAPQQVVNPFAMPQRIAPTWYGGAQFGVPYNQTAAMTANAQQQSPLANIPFTNKTGTPPSFDPSAVNNIIARNQVQQVQQYLNNAQGIDTHIPTAEDVPHVMERNEPEITMPPNQVQRPIPIAEDVPHTSQGNEPEVTVQKQQKKGGVPAYFDLIKTLDMGALLRNMVQGPPPSVQTPLTHFQRIKYDRGLFDTSRQQLRESGARSMYEARQQLGQAGDIQNLMLGLNAQQQQGLAQLGQQHREMDMQERLANQQIQAQEEQVQDQQVQQEAMLNYQIQQQAQMAKDQAVSTQLSNIKKDIREQTQYEIMKEAVDKQDARDEAYRKAQEQIGLAGVNMTLESMYQKLPQYQEGLKAKRRELLSSTGAGIMEQLRQDPNYSSIIPQEAVFDEQLTANLLGMPERVRLAQEDLTGYQTQYEAQNTKVQDIQKLYDEEQDQAKKERLLSQLVEAQGILSSLKSNVDKMQQQYTSLSDQYKWMGEAQKRFNQQWDMSGISKTYDTEFRSTSPLFKTMEALSRYVQ